MCGRAAVEYQGERVQKSEGGKGLVFGRGRLKSFRTVSGLLTESKRLKGRYISLRI